MEVTNMPDMKLTENVKAKGKLKIGLLKLKRETLRELDAGELKQAQGGARTGGCTGGCTRRLTCQESCRRCE
jgi:hypothetical protein